METFWIWGMKKNRFVLFICFYRGGDLIQEPEISVTYGCVRLSVSPGKLFFSVAQSRLDKAYLVLKSWMISTVEFPPSEAKISLPVLFNYNNTIGTKSPRHSYQLNNGSSPSRFPIFIRFNCTYRYCWLLSKLCIIVCRNPWTWFYND